MLEIKSKKLKKWIIAVATVSILSVSFGCTKSSTPPSPSAALSTGSQSDTLQDKDLTKKILSENIVEGGQVYVVQDDAVALIIIKKGTDEKLTKDLATKYAEVLKKKYKDKKVNVHAKMDGADVAHITL